jgi:hypothetical protein
MTGRAFGDVPSWSDARIEASTDTVSFLAPRACRPNAAGAFCSAKPSAFVAEKPNTSARGTALFASDSRTRAAARAADTSSFDGGSFVEPIAVPVAGLGASLGRELPSEESARAMALRGDEKRTFRFVFVSASPIIAAIALARAGAAKSAGGAEGCFLFSANVF